MQKAFVTEFAGISTGNARLTVEALSGIGKMIAFGSSVANGSQDPSTFEMAYADSGLSIDIAERPGEVAASCNHIVTTTPATAPLITAAQVEPGTHIAAVGSDTADKIELDPGVSPGQG